jgi:uncharacterized SAM-binding protein YcdF (DUF218 family)
VLVVAFGAATARLFIWPPTGMPARVDAIVVLGGQGSRLDFGLSLASEDRAPFLVLSEGLPWIRPGLCHQHLGGVTVICFQPEPDTTRGEAEVTTRLARQHAWHSLVLVTTPDQTVRAEIRLRRCFAGEVYGVTTPLPRDQWPYAIAYQWASTAKAETYDRQC